jgi:hypothetical protein
MIAHAVRTCYSPRPLRRRAAACGPSTSSPIHAALTCRENRNNDVARNSRSVRMWLLPIFVTEPSRSLPPDDRCFDVRPSGKHPSMRRVHFNHPRTAAYRSNAVRQTFIVKRCNFCDHVAQRPGRSRSEVQFLFKLAGKGERKCRQVLLAMCRG